MCFKNFGTYYIANMEEYYSIILAKINGNDNSL